MKLRCLSMKDSRLVDITTKAEVKAMPLGNPRVFSIEDTCTSKDSVNRKKLIETRKPKGANAYAWSSGHSDGGVEYNPNSITTVSKQFFAVQYYKI